MRSEKSIEVDGRTRAGRDSGLSPREAYSLHQQQVDSLPEEKTKEIEDQDTKSIDLKICFLVVVA